MRFGAKQHPICWLGLRRIGECLQRHFNDARRSVKRQPLDRRAHAGDHIMAPSRCETAGSYTANAAEADHGDGRPLLLFG